MPSPRAPETAFDSSGYPPAVVSSPPVAKQYSGDDVQRIIARALELESDLGSEDASGAPSADRFDDADLQRIANEVGIPEKALRMALTEHRSPAVNVELEGNTARVACSIPGVLDQDALERLEREVSSIMAQESGGSPIGLPGKTVLGGSSIRYGTGYFKEQLEGHKLSMTVRTTGHSVDVEIVDEMGNTVVGLYGGLVGGVGLGAGLGIGLGVGLGALGSVAFSIVVPVVTITGVYALARHLVRRFKEKRASEVRRIAESLVAAITTEMARDREIER